MALPTDVGVVLVIGVGFSAFSVLALLLRFWAEYRTRWWRRFGVSTPGRVVRVDDSDESTTHFVHYLDPSGVTHETHTRSSGASLHVGELVEVLYDPSQPWRGRIAADLENQHRVAGLLVLGFGLLGLSLCLLGLGLWLFN